jgi:hypothetical protein
VPFEYNFDGHADPQVFGRTSDDVSEEVKLGLFDELDRRENEWNSQARNPRLKVHRERGDACAA